MFTYQLIYIQSYIEIYKSILSINLYTLFKHTFSSHDGVVPIFFNCICASGWTDQFLNSNLWCSYCKQKVMLAGVAVVSPFFWLSFPWRLLSSLFHSFSFLVWRGVVRQHGHLHKPPMLMSMWHVFMSLLQTSLKRRRGLPTGRVPSTNSPYSRYLGMRPLSILLY